MHSQPGAPFQVADQCGAELCVGGKVRVVGSQAHQGGDDDELAALWRQAVAVKLPGHGINDPGFLQPARPMSAIDG